MIDTVGRRPVISPIASIALREDGGFRSQRSATAEFGNGTSTVHRQIRRRPRASRPPSIGSD